MTYFISDIHGAYAQLMRLLEKIKFSSSDSLIVLGDMIDKGEASVRVLNALYNMPNATCIAGNHEFQFLKYYRALMQQMLTDFEDVLKRVQGMFPKDGALLAWEILDWIDALPYYLVAPEYIGVHAGVPLTKEGKIKPLEEEPVERLVYDRTFKDPETVVNDNRTVLFGHTPTVYINGTGGIIRYPRINGRGIARVHLDTGGFLTGVLGCYCFETDACYYVTKEQA